MIIDGRQLARDREAVLRNKVLRFIRLNRRKPSLLAIELSADPGSRLYLKLKKAAAERIGIRFQISDFRFQISPTLTESLSNILPDTTNKNGRNWLTKSRRKKTLTV